MKYGEMLELTQNALNFKELILEVSMAISLLKVLQENENEFIDDLFEDICDTYSAVVQAQMTQMFLEVLLENLIRKNNKCAN